MPKTSKRFLFKGTMYEVGKSDVPASVLNDPAASPELRAAFGAAPVEDGNAKESAQTGPIGPGDPTPSPSLIAGEPNSIAHDQSSDDDEDQGSPKRKTSKPK